VDARPKDRDDIQNLRRLLWKSSKSAFVAIWKQQSMLFWVNCPKWVRSFSSIPPSFVYFFFMQQNYTKTRLFRESW
jgi:hypothetical protein